MLSWPSISDRSDQLISHSRHVPLSALNQQPHFLWKLPFLPHDINADEDKSLAWCRLIGFFVGSGEIRDDSRSQCVLLHQRETGPGYLQPVLDLLQLDYSCDDDSKHSRYRLSVESLSAFFLPMACGDVGQKIARREAEACSLRRCLFYPWKSLLSCAQARALIEGWVAADSDCASLGTQSLSGSTCSIPLRDDLMLVGALANCRVHAFVSEPAASAKSSSGEQQKASLVDQWSLAFDYSKVGSLDIATVGLYRPQLHVNPQHDGQVYSISVPNQSYYARRLPPAGHRGELRLSPFFTGNSSKVIPCKMPKDLQSACDRYKRFYLNRHSGHKLEWRFDQGQGEVVVDFSPACRKGLVVSTYQMLVLLVFNTVRRVTYKEIVEMTGIPKYEIANHLLSLCHPKVSVVLKRPNNKKLEDAHQFMLNAQYKNALKKVAIPLLRAVEAEDSGEEENKAIELQRRHQMDAAIVRIMKTRKQQRHNLLVAEVISQLSARFKPKPNDIKKRIEALIEQEYMERDKDERGTYNYLA